MTLPLLVVPEALFPDPGSARDWLARELARPEYQKSLADRFSRWFQNVLDAAQASAGQGGLNPVVALVLLTLLAAAAAFALSRLRANPTARVPDAAVFSEARLSAEEHRSRARAALDEDQWAAAVVESVRALAAGLFERGLVQEQSGVTVHELGERAAALFPDHRARLERMALVFDETRYGGRPADERSAREVVELERELSALHPSDTGPRGPVSAVPR